VTILDPRFRLISTRISHGRTHKLYRNPWLISEASDLLARAGWDPGSGSAQVPMTNVADALVVRFTGDFPPNGLCDMQAELVDGSGNSNRLWCIAWQNGGGRYGAIWMLGVPLTNAVTIRLHNGVGQPALAEIRLQGR